MAAATTCVSFAIAALFAVAVIAPPPPVIVADAAADDPNTILWGLLFVRRVLLPFPFSCETLLLFGCVDDTADGDGVVPSSL